MDLHSVMLTLHIIAGSVALLTMMMAYVTKKARKHAKWARVRLAMVAVGLGGHLVLLGCLDILLLIAFFPRIWCSSVGALPRTERRH